MNKLISSMKIGVILILLLAVFALSACRYYDTGSEQADQMFEQLIQAMENQDAASLQAMFSPNVVGSAGNMDEMVSELLDFYTGEMTTYKRYGPATHESRHGAVRTKFIDASYDVTASDGDYRIAIRICMIDSENPENVGVSSFYIIKAEDSDMSHAYWGGDKMWTPGITIEENPCPE